MFKHSFYFQFRWFTLLIKQIKTTSEEKFNHWDSDVPFISLCFDQHDVWTDIYLGI